jgi:hypothetical protein
MAITTEVEPFPLVERVGSFRSAEWVRHSKSDGAWFFLTGVEQQVLRFAQDDKVFIPGKLLKDDQL